MKITGLSEKLILKVFKTDNNKVVDDVGDKANKTIINSSKNSMRVLNIKAIRESNFLIPDAKKAFNYL